MRERFQQRLPLRIEFFLAEVEVGSGYRLIRATVRKVFTDDTRRENPCEEMTAIVSFISSRHVRYVLF